MPNFDGFSTSNVNLWQYFGLFTIVSVTRLTGPARVGTTTSQKCAAVPRRARIQGS